MDNRMDTTGPWVDVVFMQGEEYSDIADMGLDEMVDYLSQWDYGDETDAAHTHEHEHLWGSADAVTVVGEYVLSQNHRLGYVGLSRRSAGWDQNQARWKGAK